MQFETERLLLREMTMEDISAMCEIWSDPEVMAHFPNPLTADQVKEAIIKNIDRFETFGFGFWAVVLKETGRLIGDCGVTMQIINGRIKPEIGYHFNKNYWNRGYCTEAAMRCRDFVFETTPFQKVYSYMSADNAPSYRVALKNGMKKVDEYEDPNYGKLLVYSITRGEWEQLKAARESTV